MNPSEDYLENVFEKENPLEEHLPLKPIKIWFSLLGFTVLLYSLKFFFLEEIPGLYALTFFSASGLLGVSFAWALHLPSRISLVKTGVIIGAIVLAVFCYRAILTASSGLSFSFSGIAFFLALPISMFALYYFYSKRILKIRKEISDGLFSIKQTSAWLSNVQSVLSLIVISIGLLLMLDSKVVAYGVILLGVYYRLYKKGLDINSTTKHYLFYTRHFWFKQGKWLPYYEHSTLSIATPMKGQLGKFKQEDYQESSIKNARLFLIVDTNETPKSIYKFKSSEHPFKEAQDLAARMQITLEKTTESL